MTKLLICKKLTKEFHPGKGAIDIDIEIFKGEIVGFVGPNGAGKTTTLRMLVGLLNREKGSIEILGKILESFKDFPEVYKKIGFLPSEPAYYKELTPRQMFDYAIKLRGSSQEKVNEYARRLKLDLDKKISALSLGNKRKIGVILSLLDQPDLIIMDEPTSGLDPLVQHEVLEILKECAKRGAGVLLSSHNLTEIEDICDRVLVIKDARIIFSGIIRDIKTQKQKKVKFAVKDEVSLKNIIKNIETTDVDIQGEHVTILTRDLIKITQSIISEGIDDFTVEDPTLEEMFINYYR